MRLPSKKTLRALAEATAKALPEWKPCYEYPDHIWCSELFGVYLAGVLPHHKVRLLEALNVKPPRRREEEHTNKLHELAVKALSKAFGVREHTPPNSPVRYTLVDAQSVRELVGDHKGFGLDRAGTPTTEEGAGQMARKRNIDTDDTIEETTNRRRAVTGSKKKAAAKKKATSKKKAAASKKVAARAGNSKRGDLEKLLARKSGISVGEAAERLDVTIGTVRSMIGAIRASGVTVTAIGGGVFRKD